MVIQVVFRARAYVIVHSFLCDLKVTKMEVFTMYTICNKYTHYSLYITEK